MHRLESLNRALFLRLNATASAPAWELRGAETAAVGLLYLLPLLLLGLGLLGDPDRRRRTARSVLAMCLGLGLNLAIGLAWPQPRPFMVPLGHTWIPHAPDPSFPSDHMTVFTTLALAFLADRDWKVGTPLLAAALLVAWARVFLGVHFPLDMLGSVLVSGLALVLLKPLWRRVGDPLMAVLERARLALLPRTRGCRP
jgi:undecaprenyl-diphosphatase